MVKGQKYIINWSVRRSFMSCKCYAIPNAGFVSVYTGSNASSQLYQYQLTLVSIPAHTGGNVSS